MSLDAQRDELKSLASKLGLEIAATFEDAVQRGSSEDRPAFQELIADIKNKQRGWTHVLVYDTSRIARGRYIAQAFRRECQRYGVELIIARMPETDPVSAVILESVFEAMDEVHSIMSRDKGLAGMRQNVSKGWRAGGRAPLGYRLVHEATGAIRDGRPVTKSKLQLGEHADTIAAYLKARAAGEARTAVVRRLGVTWAKTTLVDLEWNALVYAGHTVWNRHREKKARGSGQSKRRPREEWLIQRDTHPALITELEAEAILSQLATSKYSEAIRKARAVSSDYLLSGLMFTSDGRPWLGAGKSYRLRPTDGQRGRWVNREAIEAAVLAQVRADVRSEAFVERLTAATRAWYPETDPGQELEKEAQRIEREAERAAKLSLETTEPQVFIHLMEAKRRQAEAIRKQAEAARRDEAVAKATRAITPATVRAALRDAQGSAALVRNLVARVVLEPDLACRIDYLPAIGHSLSVASPGGSVCRTVSSAVGWR